MRGDAPCLKADLTSGCQQVVPSCSAGQIDAITQHPVRV